MRTLMLLMPLLGWFLAWGLGGWLVARGAFRVSRAEQVPLALMTGVSLQLLFANMLSMVLSPTPAFWLGALLVLVLGLVFTIRADWRDVLQVPILPGQIVALVGSFWVMFLLQRGLAIFDDFAHLPTVSLMATGDIPPHFPYDPSVLYAYHHFILLLGAQIARIGGLPVWGALDIARALAFAIPAVLAGAWVQRLTRSPAAGVLGYLMVVFGAGVRWLALALPGPVVRWLSAAVEMIGSGRGSGEDFAAALSGFWAVEGTGHISIPFAFANGLVPPGILAANGPNSLIHLGASVFFLQTFNHWRSWRGGGVSALMLATLALQVEFGVVIGIVGWGALVLLYVVQHRTWRLPASLWRWLVVVAAGNALGALQGGALTDIAAGSLRQLLGETVASYQTVGFTLSLKPVIVSAHLGVLELTSLPQLLVALFEVGPILLVTPLLAVWGYKAYRCGRWYEAAFILSTFLALGAVFILFTGSTGVRNTTRLYSFFNAFLLYSAPLFWLWAARRSQAVKVTVGLLGLAVLFGGLVLLGILFPLAQRPAASYFIEPLDARIEFAYWDRLEPGALVFDPQPSRATTVLGRPTNAAYTWYAYKPEWEDLKGDPSPARLQAAGYRYAYLDNVYLGQLGAAYEQRFQDPCVQVIVELTDSQQNFRRLLDVSACR